MEGQVPGRQLILKQIFPIIDWRAGSAKSKTLFCSVCDTYNRAVLDGTNLSVMLMESLFLYIILLSPVSMYRYISTPQICREEVRTDSMTMTKNNSTTTSQITTFLDLDSGYSAGTPTSRDPLRSAPMKADTSLAEFFSRPLKIDSFQWEVGGPPLDISYPIWGLYWNDAIVLEKINRYKLLTADLHIRILVNGSPFHYGRAIASYTPLSAYDDLTRDRSLVPEDIVALSQRPHVYIDPSKSEGGDIHCPFVWLTNAIDIPSIDWNKMGSLAFRTIQGLKHSNGATDPITVNVYAWATNVQIGVPTQRITADNPSLLSASEIRLDAKKGKNDEYGQGPISKPASTIANIAGKLSGVPTIGAFAKATQMGASAIAGIASVFGYSRTPILETHIYRPETKSNFAVGNMEDDVQKLSVDVKQELTIDTRTFGLGGDDELDIQRIAGVESFLISFIWAVGASSEQILFTALVDPMVYRINTSTFPDDLEYHLPACAFATLPFYKWRGTMHYRFQVVCSRYHRGRLKVVYEPTAVDQSGNSVYNAAYTTVVDISECTDFSIAIGWGQAETFRYRFYMGEIGQAAMYSNNTLPQSSTSWEVAPTIDRVPYGNGYMSVYVVNELAVPDSTIDNDIEINVFVSAGDDFEVAEPTGRELSQMRVRTQSEVPSFPPELERSEVRPDAEEENAQTTVESNAPEVDVDANLLGANINMADKATDVHFGEVIRSFRPLLKRYNQIERFPVDLASGLNLFVQLTRFAMPPWPGYVSKVGATDLDNVGLQPVKLSEVYDYKYYVYGHTSLLTYVSSAFVCWRGSIRWFVDADPYSTARSIVQTPRIQRYSQINPGQEVIALNSNSGLEESRIEIQALENQNTGLDGFNYQSNSINPTVSVDIPFYSNYRFAPARWLFNWRRSGSDLIDRWIGESSDPYPFMPSWIYTIGLGSFFDSTVLNETQSSRSILTAAAAGDDFTVGFFIGAPPMFFQPVPIEVNPPPA